MIRGSTLPLFAAPLNCGPAWFHWLQVELDCAAVEREKQRLVGENAQLRAALKAYLDGLAVNEDVLADRLNSLLYVGAQTIKPAAERSLRRNPDAPPVLVLAGAGRR